MDLLSLWKRKKNKNNRFIRWSRGRKKHYHINLKVYFKDGKQDALTETYRESGALFSRENFIDGKKEGLTEKYYDSGEVWIAENYKDGVYDGLVEYFNKDGTLQKTETWKDDKMIDEVNH